MLQTLILFLISLDNCLHRTYASKGPHQRSIWLTEFCYLGKGWLKPYAAFCFLRDFFETSDHSQWGTFSDYTDDKVLFAFILFKFSDRISLSFPDVFHLDGFSNISHL